MDDCGLRSAEEIKDIQWASSTQGRSENTSGPIQSIGNSIASMQTRQSITGNHYTPEQTNICCDTYHSSTDLAPDMNEWNNRERLGTDSMPMDNSSTKETWPYVSTIGKTSEQNFGQPALKEKLWNGCNMPQWAGKQDQEHLNHNQVDHPHLN